MLPLLSLANEPDGLKSATPLSKSMKIARNSVLKAALTAVCIIFNGSAWAQSPSRTAEILPVYKIPVQDLVSTPAAPRTPGTTSTSAAKLRPGTPLQVRVQPDSLPSWVTNQPTASLQYGAAPAVVTLHIGHKDKIQKD
jgi:hypothetical protein